MLADTCILTVCDCKKRILAPKAGWSFLLPNNIQHWDRQIQICSNALWYPVAGDMFQCKLDKCFAHIKNLIVIADNTMVVGRKHNQKDHDLAFTTLLQTARKCNVKLKCEKLQYKCMEVNFYGETYTTDSHKPGQSKIITIVKMPSPSSKKEVQSFISMRNYLSKFSPRLTELADPIRALVKEKVPFNWGLEHPESFAMLKKDS